MRGTDGLTAYQRLHGRRPPQEMLPIGETVLYKEIRVSRPGNREMRFSKGIWLGVRPGGAESYIGTPEGVKRAREVRRLSDEDKWSRELIFSIRGTPWDHESGDWFHEFDGDVPSRVVHEHRPPPAGVQPPAPRHMAREPITQKDLDKFGYTDGRLRRNAARRKKQAKP